MNRKLQKGMLAVLMANIINLIFGLLTNFLLPKYLSVDSYSAIKTYQLYELYIGIFALGASDGMYLRYGGKELEHIDKGHLHSDLSTIRLFLIVENIGFLVLSVFIRDKIIFATCLTIMTLNMAGYFKNLYQAVGEFKKYGNILNLTTGLTFLVNIFLLFVIKTDNYFIYLLGYAAVDAGIWLMLENYSRKFFGKDIEKKGLNFSAFIQDAKDGFLLMVGNFSSIILTSMDRWFVKAMMSSLDFAQYAFAVSLEGFLNKAVTPVTVTLYNYFCNHKEKESVLKARKYVLLFASVLIAAAFPAKFIIQIFLDKYLESVSVMFVLFGAQLFYVPIKGIYVNLYKAYARQKMYFIKLVSILGIGFVLNILFVQLYNDKIAFAFATLVSSIIWMILSILDFKQYPISLQEIAYAFIALISYLLLGFYTGAIVGCILYVIIVGIFACLFFRKELTVVVNDLLSQLKKKKKIRE